MFVRCAVARVLASILACTASAAVYAQGTAWPAKPVRIVFPSGPGGPNEAIVRLIGNRLQDAWRQPVIVEFRPGGGIIIGTDAVAKSPGDGHTLGIAFGALMSTYILQGPKLPYDTLKDLTGVTEIGNTPFGLYAHPTFAPQTVADIIDYAKKNPGKLDYAGTPTAGASHLSGELLNSMAGIRMIHVSYKGTGAAQIDVIGGRVPLWFSSIGEEMRGIVAQKQLRIVATTGATRSAAFPDTPAIAETLPGFNVVGILGVIAPGTIARDLRNRISADFGRAIQSPEVNERMRQLGMTPVGSSAEQFNARIASEIQRWDKVIKESGIRAD
jgi:tripartite-type tricarboxylate transporter receptor subunit TctC